MSVVRFGPELVEETIAGDLVAQSRATFASQEDQVRYLADRIRDESALPSIRARARDIVFRVHNSTQRNRAAYAVSIAKWVKANIQYVEEDPEVFQDAPTTLGMGYGDCDDMMRLTGALARSVGVAIEVVGMEWEHPDSGRAFQHIYVRAVIPWGLGSWRVPLDVTLPRPVEDLTDPIRLALEMGHDLRVVVVPV